MKVRLNKRTVAAAKYEGPGGCYLWDIETRGFGLGAGKNCAGAFCSAPRAEK